MSREASVARKTKETDIRLRLDVDGTGASNIRTGTDWSQQAYLKASNADACLFVSANLPAVFG